MSLNNLNNLNLFELKNHQKKRDPAIGDNMRAKYEQLAVVDPATSMLSEQSSRTGDTTDVLNSQIQQPITSSTIYIQSSYSQEDTLLATSSNETINDDWYDVGSSLILSGTASDDNDCRDNDNYGNHEPNGSVEYDLHSRRQQIREQKQSHDLDNNMLNGSVIHAANGSANGKAMQSSIVNRWFSQGSQLGRKLGKDRRTISQSMLELDRTFCKGFKVKWRNLSYCYNSSWNYRLSSNRSDPIEGQVISNLPNIEAHGQSGNKRQQQQTLSNISGEFSSNQLVALIGPSGCGKTTLLKFLAGSNAAHKDKIRICGMQNPKVAFIGQDDCLINGLTPRETLMFASRLQHSDNSFDHTSHIQTILDELGLAECADRSVTKLSGGQIKRVIIAQELLYPTNLLILDEVTSGLDASTSYSIIKLLKYLVSDKSYPMSIVISIHQPSARLFDVFDKVYVMSDGCCLYEGSCKVDIVNQYLTQFGLKCPRFHNIADYLIEIACEDNHSQIKVIKEQMVQYQRKIYDGIRSNNVDRSQLESISYNCSRTSIDKSSVSKDLEKFADDNSNKTARKTSSLAGDLNFNDLKIPENNNGLKNMANILPDASITYPTHCGGSGDYSLYDSIERTRARRYRPFWDHFALHFSRSLLRIRRSHILTYLQMTTYIVLGLQLASFFGPDIGKLSGCPRLPNSLISFVLSGEVDEDLTQEMRRVQENMNFLLVAVMTSTFAALEVTVITFPLEAKSIKREWRNGWYRVSSYFLGRTLADLPFQIVYVIIFCLIIYTMTSQIGLMTWRFGAFVICLIMTALIAQSFGFIFGALFMNNLPAAVFTAPLCIFPTLLFSGFFSRVSQIPKMYTPFTYISHFRYAFDSLLVTLYGYDRCYCEEETLKSYHNSMQNQTSSIKDIFMYLFGSNECVTDAPGSSDNNIEETTTMVPRDEIALKQLNEQTAKTYATTTPEPTSFSGAITSALTTLAPTKFQSLEDALVDSVFQQMSGNSTTSLAPLSNVNDTNGATHFSGNGIDNLAHKFSNRIVTMLNKQSNFGHALPEKCSQFNSFLLVEFDLQNHDLIIGLAMLFMIVILTRILCNVILNFTIATRN